MKFRVLAVGTALLFCAGTAEAALTQSEKAQVKDLVARGQLDQVARVRALVARTDLTAEESISAIVDAFSAVPFDDKRYAFARELVFGGASTASRPLLAHGTTKALIARAEGIYQKYIGGLEHEPRAIAEVVGIYMFLDDRIANAGRPTSTAHDPNAGIPASTYDDCAKAFRDHVDQNARWLKGDSTIGEAAGRVRAQAQVTLLDMLPDGTTRRVDAADRLGLKGARRQILTDWGILLEDAGKLDDAAAERVRQVMMRLPGARADLEVVYAGEDRGPIHARGLVAFAGGSGLDTYPFGEELAPGQYDAQLSAVAQDLAVIAAKHALDNRGELRLQAERDVTAARAAGQFLGRLRAPTIDHAIGAAVHALIVDAQRTIDLAMVRYLGGKPESLALLSDAIGVLAAFAPAGGASLSIDVGKSGGTTTMSQIRLAPNGVATSVALEGHTWSLERSAPRRDGQAITLAHLTTARTPLKDGSQWTESGLTFTKVHGTPRAGIAPSADKNVGPTVKLVGVGAKGYDAISTPAPGDDFVVEGDLDVSGGPGGIAFRAVSGRDAVRGALLVVDPKGRTVLATSDDSGTEALLAAPIDPSPGTPVHVKISVTGTKVEAIVGSQTMNGNLPATLKKGEIGLVARAGAHVDLAKLVFKKK
jgi:hypothetical protein